MLCGKLVKLRQQTLREPLALYWVEKHLRMLLLRVGAGYGDIVWTKEAK
jgi:hypothetical protein